MSGLINIAAAPTRSDSLRRRAFTLLELLVVIAIIGILAAISLPAMKGIGKSNKMTIAAQQLVDDLSLARSQAINRRTTVHMVFVPQDWSLLQILTPSDDAARRNLEHRGYRTYGFFAERRVGDQPGRENWFHEYIDEWKSLPDGIMIDTNEFVVFAANPANHYPAWVASDPESRPLDLKSLPFPLGTTTNLNWVPHIAFGPDGGLIDSRGNRMFSTEYIGFIRGSVLNVKPDRLRPANQTYYDVKTYPADTNTMVRVSIDGFTGKARVDRPRIQ